MTDDPDVENRRALALACHNHALFLTKKGQFETARQTYERTIQLRKQLIEEHPDEDRYPRELAGSYVNLGALSMREQQPERARAELNRAAALLRRQPLDVENRYLLAGIYHDLGMVEQNQKPKQAIEDFQQALKLWMDLLDQFPAVPDYRHRAASVRFLLGVQYEAEGRLPEAREEMRRYLALSREVVRQAPDVPEYQRDLRQGLYHLARLLHAGGQNVEADALWREELVLLVKTVREQPNQARVHRDLSYVLGELGDLDRERGIQGALRRAGPCCRRRRTSASPCTI